MKNKLKEYFKSVAINLSLVAHNMENMLLKNTDVENKSGNGGSFEIQKEHKNDVLNKMRRGEKHEEYVQYYYKLLELADKVDVNSKMFSKYKDNINFDTFDQTYIDPLTGEKETITENYIDPSKHIDKKREFNNPKINEHYKFIKTIKFNYSLGDIYSDGYKTIDFEPSNIFKTNNYNKLDFINVRSFNEENLLFEFWLKKDTNLYSKLDQGYDFSIKDYDVIGELKMLDSFVEYYLNKKNTYKIDKYISLNEYNNHIILTFGGKQINEQQN